MKKQTFIYIFFFFYFAPVLLAQKCEDLPSIVPSMKEDTNKVNLLWKWAGCYTGSHPDSVIILCEQGAELAKKLNFTEGVFKCLARPTASYMKVGKEKKAKANLDFALSFAKKLKDTVNIMRFLDASATYHEYLNESEAALVLAKEGVRLSLLTNDEYRLPDFYIHEVLYYCKNADYKNGLDAAFKALPIFEKQGDKKGQVKTLANITISYYNSGIDWVKYETYAQQSLKLAKEINDKFAQINMLCTLGDYSITIQKDTLKSIAYYEQALKLAREVNYTASIALALCNMGRGYSYMGNHPKAITCLEEGIALAEQNKNGTLVGMGSKYLADSYFSAGNYAQSAELLEKYLANIPFGTDKINRVNALNSISKAYAKIGKYDKAYDYQAQYQIQYDSLLNTDNQLKIKDLESNYQLDKKDYQLKLLNQEQALSLVNLAKQETEAQRQKLFAEQQRLLAQSTETARQLLERDNQLKDFELRDQADSLNYQQLQVAFEKKDKAQKLAEAALLQEGEASKRRWAISILCGLLLLSGIGFYFWRARQKAISDKKLVESELKALRSQLNPHFLFNSMNAINSYILDNDRLKASEYLAQFASVMRGILETSRNTTVSLEKDLQLLENYILIEQKRFSKPFDYKINIAENIDTFSTQVPAMLLQPFVENAIWHGFLHKPTKGHLSIEVKRENEQLVFIIEDDGIGRQKSATLTTKQDSQQSLGIKINEERLRLINTTTQANHISIKDLVNSEGLSQGTQVVILLSDEKN